MIERHHQMRAPCLGRPPSKGCSVFRGMTLMKQLEKPHKEHSSIMLSLKTIKMRLALAQSGFALSLMAMKVSLEWAACSHLQ